MIKYFKTFFSPPVVTYSYRQPKELIINKVREIFYKKLSLPTNNDLRIMFLSEEIFAINSILPWRIASLMLSSTLVGKIIEPKPGFTHIKTTARPGFGLYFLFFLALILGIAYLYIFISTGSSVFLFRSLTSIILGSAFSLVVSNVAIKSIRQRYERFINDDLRPASISTMSV